MTDRLPSVIASTVGARAEISIRHASPADTPALESLARLADRRAPAGPVLVAEADGEIVAAIGGDGGVVTNPFLVTLDLVELLRVRASQLHAAAA
jgi:hypothetical protein